MEKPASIAVTPPTVRQRRFLAELEGLEIPLRKEILAIAKKSPTLACVVAVAHGIALFDDELFGDELNRVVRRVCMEKEFLRTPIGNALARAMEDPKS